MAPRLGHLDRLARNRFSFTLHELLTGQGDLVPAAVWPEQGHPGLSGALSTDELKGYAEQYRFFERNLPLFLVDLSDQLIAGPTRDAILANLNDEVAPPSH